MTKDKDGNPVVSSLSPDGVPYLPQHPPMRQPSPSGFQATDNCTPQPPEDASDKEVVLWYWQNVIRGQIYADPETRAQVAKTMAMHHGMLSKNGPPEIPVDSPPATTSSARPMSPGAFLDQEVRAVRAAAGDMNYAPAGAGADAEEDDAGADF